MELFDLEAYPTRPQFAWRISSLVPRRSRRLSGACRPLLTGALSCWRLLKPPKVGTVARKRAGGDCGVVETETSILLARYLRHDRFEVIIPATKSVFASDTA